VGGLVSVATTSRRRGTDELYQQRCWIGGGGFLLQRRSCDLRAVAAV